VNGFDLFGFCPLQSSSVQCLYQDDRKSFNLAHLQNSHLFQVNH
jgi:hypothetical protein